jgi:hypothetical protein
MNQEEYNAKQYIKDNIFIIISIVIIAEIVSQLIEEMCK